jgi:hypothetical protein
MDKVRPENQSAHTPSTYRALARARSSPMRAVAARVVGDQAPYLAVWVRARLARAREVRKNG